MLVAGLCCVIAGLLVFLFHVSRKHGEYLSLNEEMCYVFTGLQAEMFHEYERGYADGDSGESIAPEVLQPPDSATLQERVIAAYRRAYMAGRADAGQKGPNAVALWQMDGGFSSDRLPDLSGWRFFLWPVGPHKKSSAAFRIRV